MSSKQNTAGHLIGLILFVLILLPLFTVFIQIVLPQLDPEQFDLSNLSLIIEGFERPLWKTAFFNSLKLGVGTTTIGVCLATVLAYIRVNYEFAGRKMLDLTAWILIIVPSFILAQGWIFFSSGNGIAAEWLGISGLNKFIFSYWGLVFVLVLCKFPLAYITIKNTLELSPASLIQAAQMNGASAKYIWLKVRLPLCLPAFLSSAMLIFMDTIGDYGMSSTITAAFPFPTLPYTIYSAITTTPSRFDMAGVLSFYLIILIIFAMTIQSLAIGRKKFDFLGNDTMEVVPKKLSKGGSIACSVFVIGFCLLALGVPIGSNIIMSFSDSISIGRFSFTLDNYVEVLSGRDNLLGGLTNSLKIAASAATGGIIIGFCVAYLLSYSSYKYKKVIDSMTLIAMAIPGVVLGIGYIFVWNQKWLANIGMDLYGKPEILILASIATAIPLTNRILVSGMAKIPSDLLVAGQMQGASFFRCIRSILLPLLHVTVVSALLSAFGSSVFNLAITTILFPPRFNTLPVYIADAYNSLKFGYSAAATIVGGGIVVLIICGLEILLKWRKKPNEDTTKN
ncbi:MAG: ABC transporter permease [Epulopiscium sp. Nele67-Bin004]|nr:MAG: ABC transporter permease [Epulopiscium sp. Nele67-Bin004]